MTPEKAFGNVLREIRQGHSLSQEELRFESGCHRTYISLLERGKEGPSLNTTWTPLTGWKNWKWHFLNEPREVLKNEENLLFD